MRSEDIQLVDGSVTLPAVVRRPERPGPWPGIVLGAGGLGQGNIHEMDWLGTPLVEAGFMVVSISYRAAYPGDDDRDFGLGLDVLQKEANVDQERIALVGDSRGGMSALRTAAVDKRVKAVVGLAPPCDMKHNVRGTMLYAPMRHQTQIVMMGGEPDEVPHLYERVQAISYADRIKVPVLMVHGLFDLHAPAEMSIYMERELRRHGHNDVTVELLEGLGHFWERQHWGDEHWRVIEIVRAWLLKKIGTQEMVKAQAKA